MFGHQDSDQHDNQQPVAAGNDQAQPGQDVWQPAAGSTPVDNSSSSPAFNPSVGGPGDAASSAPVDQPTVADQPSYDEQPQPVNDEPPVEVENDAPAATNDLLDIKQQALGQLSPIVDHLDQSPEEKFRTTMMMIQATDNHALIKDAYAAANAIPDEKAKAQALLDVINEINYFTQHSV
jgi:hypothetical protein